MLRAGETTKPEKHMKELLGKKCIQIFSKENRKKKRRRSSFQTKRKENTHPKKNRISIWTAVVSHPWCYRKTIK